MDTLAPDMKFEEAIKLLEDTVKKLETGGLSLDDSISYYTRGKELKEICDKRLKEAQLKVEKIIQNDDNNISTVPFDTDTK